MADQVQDAVSILLVAVFGLWLASIPLLIALPSTVVVACLKQHTSHAKVTTTRQAGCVVRDIRARKDIGTFHSTYVASSVKGHDSAFLVVQARES